MNENENATVRILDDRDTIMRKFKRAVTDSEARVYYSEEKKGIAKPGTKTVTVTKPSAGSALRSTK